MSSTNTYDVIIIGAGMGGLSSAIHASKKGMNVLVLEQLPTYGGKATQSIEQGFLFDQGPSIIMMKEIYEELLGDAIQFDALDPIFRLATESGKTYDIPSGQQASLEYISQMFPEDIGGFRTILKLGEKLYPHVMESFFAKPTHSFTDFLNPHMLPFATSPILLKPYKACIDSLFRSPVLRAWLYSFPTYTGQTYQTIAPGALIIPYVMIATGLYYPRGGVGAIPKTAYEYAEKLGVTFKFNTKVTELVVKGLRASEVITSEGKRYSAHSFISNRDLPNTQSLLHKDFKGVSGFSYITWQAGIRKKIKKLAHHTTFIPTDYETYYEELYVKKTLPHKPILYLHTPSATHANTAPKDCESIFCVIPVHSEAMNWDPFDSKAYMLSQLKHYGITIHNDDIVCERNQTPRYFEQQHGNYKGSLFGAPSQYMFGILPSPNRNKLIKNLAYCGGSVQPGAGLPMVTLSGKFAVDQILKVNS